jgi:pyruvate dehydrogenase E1 component
MYGDPEYKDDVFYYITLYNDNYPMLPMPEGREEGILKGMYRLRPAASKSKQPRAHLLGSGPLLPYALKAQELLAEFGVAADVWSVTSYKELRREALEVEHWNLLHPTEKPRESYVQRLLAKEEGEFIAVSDFMKSVPEMIQRWVPGGLYPLGTDGFGRSDTRAALRRHFEIDAECITVATLYRLARRSVIKPAVVQQAIEKLKIDPDKPDPVRA